MENPKPRSKGKFRNYGEWLAGRKRPLTYQDRLRAAIDTALAKRPADFPEFLSLMEQAGYEVKQRRGAVSFRAPGQERFTRLRSNTLGDGYGEADIKAALSGSRHRPGQPRQKVSLAILYFPMLIFSGATLPFEVMPKGMQTVVQLFPMTQGIQLMKSTFLGTPLSNVWLPVLVMLAVTIICAGVAIKCFKWE